MTLIAIVYIFIAISVSLYVYLKRSHSYWERTGVPTSLKPVHLIYGSDKKATLRKIPFWEFITNFYNELKGRGLKHGGFYSFNVGFWLPVDHELIKNILTRDFSYFMNHNSNIGVNHERLAKKDPIQLNLFTSIDDKWRKLRIKLTPTFTSGKLKMMFHTLYAITPGLEEVLNSYATVQDPFEVKDVIARFTTDVIGTCAFGLECNSLKNPDSEFRQFGSRILNFRPEGLKQLRLILSAVAPRKLRGIIRPKFFSQEVEDFFKHIVDQTVEYRETNNVFRKDFMHLLIQLKNKGVVTDDESLMSNPHEVVKPDQSITMTELLAQCVLFFLAGFETSATGISFALLEIAQNEEIQDKLRDEINAMLKEHDGKISYESVTSMKYMDMVVNETLRKYPPVPTLPRFCTKDYTIPDTNVVIKRGVGVQIPVWSLHYDPDFYPDPHKFDPERFTEENKAKRPPYTFLPFGEGPRFCIGARFGQMTVKVGLLAIIKNFKVSLSSKMKVPVKYVPNTVFPVAEGGIWLNVNKIE